MSERCAAAICKRDTYRHTGRGKSGYEMHYYRCQCSRRAIAGQFCGQHAKMAADGWYMDTWERPSPTRTAGIKEG